MSVKIKLKNPITVGGETIVELNLREPTVSDVAELGYPYLVVTGDVGTGMQLLPKVTLNYVSKLAAVPPSSLNSLTLSELSELQGCVMGFFMVGAETFPGSSIEPLK